MARQTRLVIPGLAHLLSLPALPDVQPFPTEGDRARFLGMLRETATAQPLQVHAFALMSGEVRALATPADEAALSHWIQAVGRRYVSAYNRQYGRSGTLWAGRFRCAAIEPGAWTLRALRLVDSACTESGATSAAQRTGGARDWPMVDPQEYWSLGNTPFERENAYAGLLAEPMAAAHLDRIRRCLSGGWACGEDPFLRRIAAGRSRRASPRPRGRPRASTTNQSA